MLKQKVYFTLIRLNPKTMESEHLTDWDYIYFFGKDEDEIYEKAWSRLRELADRAGQYVDPDDVTFKDVEECDDMDLHYIDCYGEQKYGEEVI